jgi:hypothetical protein
MKTKRSTIFYPISFFLLLCGAGLCANNSNTAAAETAPYDIRIKDNLMSVQLQNIPLQKVFEEIASRTWIKTVIYASPQDLLAAHFNDLPLEKGIRRLTGKYNSMFIYGPEKDKNGKPKLSKIIILPKNFKGASGARNPAVIVADRPRPGKLKAFDFQSLVKALKDNDEDIREDAVDHLAELPDERVIKILSEVMINDEEEDVRAAAATALGDIRNQTAVYALIKAMQDDDIWVRESVVEALGKIGGKRVVAPLEEALEDEDEDVRKAAADALDNLGI